MQTREEELEAAAKRWEKLAEEERERSAWDASLGHYTAVIDRRARLYDDTAESLRLQIRTGVPHCACHLKPMPGVA